MNMISNSTQCTVYGTWKYWWDVQLDQFIILFQLSSVMGSISSSIFCTWVSWHGIGKKSWEERKSKTLILSVSSSMLVTVKVVKMAKKIDHYDIVTLNIVTHHLVPLLLALRGQDHGADSAWALGLHIIVIFEFVLSEQIGSDFFLLIRNSFPRLPCSWQQSKLGNMIKKKVEEEEEICTFSFFSLFLFCTTSISPPPSSLFFTSCSAFWKWQKATCTLFLLLPRIPLWRLWSELLTWFGVNMKLFDSCSGAARSWWKDRDIKANTLAKEYL